MSIFHAMRLRDVAFLIGISALTACAQPVAVTTPTGTVTVTPTPVASTPASPLQSLANFTVADINAADADAVANGDTIAHACYPVLASFVQSIPTSAGTVAGAISAFQKARDLANHVQAGLPVSLKLACAPLLLDDQAMIARLAAIGVGSAATSGAILPVPLVPLP